MPKKDHFYEGYQDSPKEGKTNWFCSCGKKGEMTTPESGSVDDKAFQMFTRHEQTHLKMGD